MHDFVCFNKVVATKEVNRNGFVYFFEVKDLLYLFSTKKRQ